MLLLAISFATAGFLFARSYHTLATLFCILGILCCWLVFKLYRVTTESVTYFFNALQNDDTSLLFPDKVGNKTLATLYENMNRLNQHYQEIRLQNEFNERYYKTLIQHSATGLLVLNSDGRIELINEVACRYAGISPESTHPNILQVKNPQFYNALCNLQPGDNQTYKQIIGNSIQILFFRATLLRKNDFAVKLVSIQDIRQELENREIESYRKLISVLTHEIMNLLSPLTSVAGSLNSLYHPDNKPVTAEKINEDILKITLSSIDVIKEQSNGLLNFMNNYRKLSRIPQPEIRAFKVGEWIDQIRIVYSGKMLENGIDFEIRAEKGIKQIEADKTLINQVVINLVNNAMDAVTENQVNKIIRIDITNTRQNRIRISVSNNGPVISADVQDKIFVPFFTTKKEGSGIGLSISQEIMKLHKGSLMVVSGPGNLTSFIMEI
jgi:signal transduction histidine kinase